MTDAARYELFYWPGLPGRGEFVRLALEDVGAPYVDLGRDDPAKGIAAIRRFLEGAESGALPFAPPFLRAGDVVVAQTVAILAFLGPRHALAPADEAGRAAALQYAMTVADVVAEAHDVHHPISGALYYDDQKPE